MKRILALLSAVSLSGLSSVASAHALHDSGASFFAGFAHPLLGLDHVLAMLAIGLGASQMLMRSAWPVPAAFAVAITAGALLAPSMIPAPVLEWLVVGSVCALGLLVLSKQHVRMGYGYAVITVFAFVHGAAHAVEQPAEFSTVAYLAGVLLASTALQIVGAAIASLLKHNARVAGLPLIAAGMWLMMSA